jgi:ABC-type anion transport system duplicated permease subunit
MAFLFFLFRTTMVGRNYGLTGWRYVARIPILAAFPAILTGLKNGYSHEGDAIHLPHRSLT